MSSHGGAASLQSGISQLRDGNSQLANGIGQLSGGGGQLTNGLGQLTSGAGQLQNGLALLTGGTGQLASGLAGGVGPAGQLITGLGLMQAGVVKARGQIPSTADLKKLQAQSPGHVQLRLLRARRGCGRSAVGSQRGDVRDQPAEGWYRGPDRRHLEVRGQ